MINDFPFSEVSISVALLGITLHAIFIKPYPGAATYRDEKKKWLYNLRKRVGVIANILIVLGTTGQWYSVIFLN